MLVFLVALCLFGHLATGQQDETCTEENEGYPCQKSGECAWFVEMKGYMVNMTKGSDERNALVEDMRSMVCNKKEEKVCCPPEEEEQLVRSCN